MKPQESIVFCFASFFTKELLLCMCVCVCVTVQGAEGTRKPQNVTCHHMSERWNTITLAA